MGVSSEGNLGGGMEVPPAGRCTPSAPRNKLLLEDKFPATLSSHCLQQIQPPVPALQRREALKDAS